jgi:hypothetical protein
MEIVREVRVVRILLPSVAHRFSEFFCFADCCDRFFAAGHVLPDLWRRVEGFVVGKKLLKKIFWLEFFPEKIRSLILLQGQFPAHGSNDLYHQTIRGHECWEILRGLRACLGICYGFFYRSRDHGNRIRYGKPGTRVRCRDYRSGFRNNSRGSVWIYRRSDRCGYL